ncbi:MAG TPA: addiction module protein [Cyclobacteriaceae bacterium]|nr:addiction module protein [Cyclobacteriaceae bacterium]
MGSKHKEILELSVAEKILLVEEIWDSILAENTTQTSDLTDAQKKELSRRLDLYRAGKTETFSWEDIKTSLK